MLPQYLKSTPYGTLHAEFFTESTDSVSNSHDLVKPGVYEYPEMGVFASSPVPSDWPETASFNEAEKPIPPRCTLFYVECEQLMCLSDRSRVINWEGSKDKIPAGTTVFGLLIDTELRRVYLICDTKVIAQNPLDLLAPLYIVPSPDEHSEFKFPLNFGDGEKPNDGFAFDLELHMKERQKFFELNRPSADPKIMDMISEYLQFCGYTATGTSKQPTALTSDFELRQHFQQKLQQEDFVEARKLLKSSGAPPSVEFQLDLLELAKLLSSPGMDRKRLQLLGIQIMTLYNDPSRTEQERKQLDRVCSLTVGSTEANREVMEECSAWPHYAFCEFLSQNKDNGLPKLYDFANNLSIQRPQVAEYLNRYLFM